VHVKVMQFLGLPSLYTEQGDPTAEWHGRNYTNWQDTTDIPLSHKVWVVILGGLIVWPFSFCFPSRTHPYRCATGLVLTIRRSRYWILYGQDLRS
jgi:hypothetical protein